MSPKEGRVVGSTMSAMLDGGGGTEAVAEETTTKDGEETAAEETTTEDGEETAAEATAASTTGAEGIGGTATDDTKGAAAEEGAANVAACIEGAVTTLTGGTSATPVADAVDAPMIDCTPYG